MENLRRRFIFMKDFTEIRICPFCGEEHAVEMTAEEHADYLVEYLNKGKRIQDVFPGWPAHKRELLVSGICSECWNSMTFELEPNPNFGKGV